MAKGKKHTPEQIVSLLRQIEVGVANGKTTPVACREGGITKQTYYQGAEGSTEAEAARAAVIERWLVRAAAAGAHQPCMVLRLRKREDLRRTDGADAESDR
jgi:hypothetical protein